MPLGCMPPVPGLVCSVFLSHWCSSADGATRFLPTVECPELASLNNSNSYISFLPCLLSSTPSCVACAPLTEILRPEKGCPALEASRLLSRALGHCWACQPVPLYILYIRSILYTMYLSSLFIKRFLHKLHYS